MYLYGALALLAPIIAGLLIGGSGGAGMAGALGVAAKPLYMQWAISRVKKADKLGLEGAEREDYLRRAGGVSIVAGVLGGLLFVALGCYRYPHHHPSRSLQVTMDRIAVFFAAIVPALLLIVYGRSKTRVEWSNEALWNAFFLGGVGAIGAIPIELGLGYLLKLSSFSPLAKAAIEAGVIAALVEEGVKFGILVGSAIHHVDRRRVADIVALGLAISIGFAAVENIFYVAAPSDWHGVAVARAITAVPGHGLDGLAMGALVAWSQLQPDKAMRFFALALIVPVLMHGAYDFPLFALAAVDAEGWRWLWLAALTGSAIVAIGLCNHVLPLAFEADRLKGFGTAAKLRARYVAAAAFILILFGVLFAATPFVRNRLDLLSALLSAAALPLALGIDLLREAFQRRRAAQASVRA